MDEVDEVVEVVEVVQVRDLRKLYGEVVAVESVSFAVVRGEVFGLLGPNGAGKTTTVECLAGLRRADGGSVRVLGLDPAKNPREVLRRVGVQLQQSALPDRMRVSEAVDVFAAAAGGRVPSVSSLLAEWGLGGKARAAFASLSGGQRQRLFIALALLGVPEVVVLDELTTGLDPAVRRDTWRMIGRLRERGTTVLFVTHDMDEASALCDRVAVVVRGRVAALGTPREIQADHPSLESAYLALVGEPVEVR